MTYRRFGSVIDGIHKLPAWIAELTEPARALGVNYQNTNGRPILCLVYVNSSRTAINGHAYVEARVENVTPPTEVVGAVGLGATGQTTIVANCLVFMVPQGFYYTAFSVVGNGANALVEWWEVIL